MIHVGKLALQRDKQFCVAGVWALASDGLQWVIQHRTGQQWHAVKFIHSDKAWLAYRLKRTLKDRQAMPTDC